MTFRDNLSGPSLGPTGCPETSARNYHYSLHNSPETAVLNTIPSCKIKEVEISKEKLCALRLNVPNANNDFSITMATCRFLDVWGVVSSDSIRGAGECQYC